MERPVMNPTFAYDAAADASKAKPRQGRFSFLWRILKRIGRLLLANPFGRNRGSFRNEEGTKLSRFVRGFTYRLAFVPVLLVMFITAIILAATHPGRSGQGADPLSFGVYYDPVNFLADDGARLEGWLVPVLDAKRVLEEKDLVVGRHYPAVVLVHDFAGSREQMLPLVQPMHDAGFVVLVINLRGSSSLTGEAQTFGIRESLDVKAAVDMLRRRSFVDPGKIALIGVGTGANACLIAASKYPAIPAMVLSEPVSSFDPAFAERVGADHKWYPPLKNLFRWTFQVMYGVDCGDLDMANYGAQLSQRNVLMTDTRQRLMEPSQLKGVKRFLQKYAVDEVASVK